MEEYRIIEGFENYSISDLGNIRNDQTGRILKLCLDTEGYNRIRLYKDKIASTQKVHRLVANMFLPNPENKKTVDHIDNNKTNNNLINLRWATLSENAQNKPLSKRSSSGVKGVSFNKRMNKWKAYIKLDGIIIHLGCYDNLEDAKQARTIRANEAFGVFTNKCEKI